MKDRIATKNADAIRMHWQVNEFDDVVFTHYFKSNCHLNCPEIVLKANADKVKSFVLEISRFLTLQVTEDALNSLDC